MPHFTVQLAYAAYYTREETVEADTFAAALERAIRAAKKSDQWDSSDWCGPTFVHAAAKGKDRDLSDPHVRECPIPSRFAERGAAPQVIVTVSGGVVQDVEIKHATAQVEVRDYDTEGCDPNDPHLRTDDTGGRYLLADWSYEIPRPRPE
jgi:hypothetical protein